jgi:hypothetical protein
MRNIIEFFEGQFDNIWGVIMWLCVAIAMLGASAMFWIAIFKLT